MRTQNKLIGLLLSCFLVVAAVSGCAPVSGVRTSSMGEAYAEAAVTAAEPEEMAAYLFVHFTGDEQDEDKEQIYFSVSTDGTTWETLNSNNYVLKSNVGEKGVRDPHIIRSPEGDKFYLIATDLSIFHLGEKYGGDKWGKSQSEGSKSIVIWESEDLVNWSEPRLRKIAHDTAGCTWAPESIYDYEREAYMIVWASMTYGKQRLFRCYTKDFETFTEPEVYIESYEKDIDTTFLYEDGVYYRFTKNEAHSFIYMEKSTSLSGEFEAVTTFTINGNSGTATTGFEGPTAYKLNGEDKWCLLLDNFGASAGYKPFVTDDITTGRFVSGGDFKFNGVKLRHGTVMPITQSEYDALIAKYPIA